MNKSEKPYKPLDRWDEICYKFKAFDHSYVKNFRSIEYINKDIEGKSSAEVVNILHQKKAEYDFFLRVIEYIHKGYSKRISLSQYYHYYKRLDTETHVKRIIEQAILLKEEIISLRVLPWLSDYFNSAFEATTVYINTKLYPENNSDLIDYDINGEPIYTGKRADAHDLFGYIFLFLDQKSYIEGLIESIDILLPYYEALSKIKNSTSINDTGKPSKLKLILLLDDFSKIEYNGNRYNRQIMVAEIAVID